MKLKNESCSEGYFIELDALLRVPRQSLYWEALAILQLSLNVLHLKSCEIQSNRCAQAILPSIAFLGIVHRRLARKMSQDRYISLWAFQSIFFSLCRCCCLFVFFFHFSKRERHFEFQSYGGAWHRATLGSVNLFKIIRGISQVWENADLKIREV